MSAAWPILMVCGVCPSLLKVSWAIGRSMPYSEAAACES